MAIQRFQWDDGDSPFSAMANGLQDFPGRGRALHHHIVGNILQVTFQHRTKFRIGIDHVCQRIQHIGKMAFIPHNKPHALGKAFVIIDGAFQHLHPAFQFLHVPLQGIILLPLRLNRRFPLFQFLFQMLQFLAVQLKVLLNFGKGVFQLGDGGFLGLNFLLQPFLLRAHLFQAFPFALKLHRNFLKSFFQLIAFLQSPPVGIHKLLIFGFDFGVGLFCSE